MLALYRGSTVYIISMLYIVAGVGNKMIDPTLS